MADQKAVGKRRKNFKQFSNKFMKSEQAVLKFLIYKCRNRMSFEVKISRRTGTIEQNWNNRTKLEQQNRTGTNMEQKRNINRT